MQVNDNKIPCNCGGMMKSRGAVDSAGGLRYRCTRRRLTIRGERTRTWIGSCGATTIIHDLPRRAIDPVTTASLLARQIADEPLLRTLPRWDPGEA